MRTPYFFVLFICFVSNAFAQINNDLKHYNLVQLSVEQGLSQANVNQILTDKEGLVWVATEEGLNKYDGYDFMVYRHQVGDSTSLSDNMIWSLMEDSKGNFWVGTNQGGLNLYNRELDNFTSYKYDIKDDSTISQNTITTLIEHSNGMLWLGTYWGINIMNPQTKNSQRIYAEYSDLIHSSIFSLLEMPNGNVWAGTSAGVSVLNANGDIIKNYVVAPNSKEGVARGNIIKIIRDSEGTIWLGSEGGGLMRYNKSTDDFSKFTHDPFDDKTIGSNVIRSIYEDKNGIFWIGTDGSGFYYMDRALETFQPVFVKSNQSIESIKSIYHIHEDKDKNIWLGSYGNGIYLLNLEKSHIESYRKEPGEENSLNHNSVLTVLERSDGKLWLGTDGGGISIFNLQDQSFEHITYNPSNPDGIGGNVIKSLIEDRDGDVWIGTYATGLFRKPKGSDKYIHYSIDSDNGKGISDNDAWILMEDSNGFIWLGTLGGGIDKYDKKTDSFSHFESDFEDLTTISSNSISCLLETSDGNIWVGTEGNGVNIINLKGEISRLTSNDEDSTSLSHNEIRSIYQDHSDNIWIGTTSGLNKFNPKDSTFTHYFEHDGMANNIIKGIVEDKNGFLWLSSNNGISKFNPSTSVFHNFDKGDGLVSKEYNYNSTIITKDNKLVFGGNNGFNILDPSKIKTTENFPELRLTSFLLMHKPVPISSTGPIKENISSAKEIVLQPDDYVFSIEYAAKGYAIPKKNQYKYLLEGFDQTWNIVGQNRLATYTNVPPGTYTFKVRATNNQGIWGDEEASIIIVSIPPWYKTYWAYALFLLLFFSAGLFILKIRTSYIQKQRRLLATEVKERTLRIEQQKEQLESSQEELAFVNKNLEREVDFRTQALRSALTRLTDSEHELQTFLYRSAHDLRGPVATLMGLANLAEKENKDADMNKYFKKLSLSTVHMHRILRKLIVVNSVLKEKTNIEKVNWLDLTDDIHEVAARLRPHFDVIIDVDQEKTFYSNTFLLKVIAGNLIENAIIFNSSNNPHAKMKITVTEDGLEMVASDNGDGISPEIEGNIFDMFYRGSDDSQGNGLGLYMVKKCCNSLNAKVTFTSTLGKGSEFKVLIPTPKNISSVLSLEKLKLEEEINLP